MPDIRYIDKDFVKFSIPRADGSMASDTLVFGDKVEVLQEGKFYKANPRTPADEKALPSYLGFERTNFGIIHVRTDGERVLVFTHSGKQGLREAYRVTVAANHAVQFAKDVEVG